MSISDSTLFAYLDCTLAADEQQRIATLAENDPGLARRIERQQRIAEAARDGFAKDLEEPVPDRWVAMIDSAMGEAYPGKIHSLAKHRAKNADLRLGWSGWQLGGAIAASLALGLYLGGTSVTPALIEERSDVMLASAPLAGALDGARSGVSVRIAGDRSVELLLSVRSRAGDYCREALVSAAGAGASRHLLACHSADGWRVVALSEGAPREAGYATATGASPLDAMIDSLGGEPLDSAAEAAAIERRWR